MERNSFDYAEDTVAPPPSAEGFAQLNELVKNAMTNARAISRMAEALSALQAMQDAYVERLIPEQMESLGLKKFTTTEGWDISVKDEFACSLAQDRMPEAEAWLTSQNQQGILKNEVVLSFVAGRGGLSEEVVLKLAEQYPQVPCTKKTSVHHMTLKSCLKKMAADGVIIPQIFLPREYKKAVLPT